LTREVEFLFAIRNRGVKLRCIILSSILIFAACSSPATEEAAAPEVTTDSTLVNSAALEEAPVADSVEVK